MDIDYSNKESLPEDIYKILGGKAVCYSIVWCNFGRQLDLRYNNSVVAYWTSSGEHIIDKELYEWWKERNPETDLGTEFAKEQERLEKMS